MSIWTRISQALQALTQGESLAAVFDHLRTPPERSVGFTIAVIALGAKMAKADGQVTRDEVRAFRQVFHIPAQDTAAASRVFDLARQDVAGYQDYARKIARMFGDDRSVLCDLMEGLFHIAMADGTYHAKENDFLVQVAEIFGLGESRFRQLRTRFVPDATPDPWSVLGASPDQSLEDVRKLWRQAVREAHPDQMIARGLPEEAVRMAERRMVDLNRAWEEIQERHG